MTGPEAFRGEFVRRRKKALFRPLGKTDMEIKLLQRSTPMANEMAPARIHWSLFKYWYLYIAAFFTVWVVPVAGWGLFPDVIRQWPIAIVMVLGSLVAGSTAMGGGAICFAYLVSWTGASPGSARDFGLMIQALGMTSAMIYVFCRRIFLQRRLLVWTGGGGIAGVLLGTVALAPYLAANFVKLIFACMWMSFAILTIAKSREFCRAVGVRAIDPRDAMRTGLLVGMTGGMIASVTGVGVEMALYTTLILFYRCDLKIAVPMAVSAMAITAMAGVAARLAQGGISHDLILKFLATGPIVVFGAPIGTYIVSKIPRQSTLYFISVLSIGQFAWTVTHMQGTSGEWLFVMVALGSATALFYWMYRQGKRNPQIIADM